MTSHDGKAGGDRDERVRVVGERIAGVPRERLGQALRKSRRKSGHSVAQAAMRCDVLQRWLIAVEAGRFSAGADVVADLLDAYGTSLDEVLPPRRGLLALDGVDRDDVLRRYIGALQRWRGGDSLGRLRAEDLEILSALLGLPAAKIERRLLRIARSQDRSGLWPAWARKRRSY